MKKNLGTRKIKGILLLSLLYIGALEIVAQNEINDFRNNLEKSEHAVTTYKLNKTQKIVDFTN